LDPSDKGRLIDTIMEADGPEGLIDALQGLMEYSEVAAEKMAMFEDMEMPDMEDAMMLYMPDAIGEAVEQLRETADLGEDQLAMIAEVFAGAAETGEAPDMEYLLEQLGGEDSEDMQMNLLEL
jgi:hypothetical protein